MAAALPYILTIGGTILSASSQMQAGENQQRMYEYQAEITRRQGELNAMALEQQANSDRATAQRAAADKHRQSRLQQSRALAVAAASGAGAVDPSVLDIIGGIAGEGELAAQTELYQGEDSAAYREYQARMYRASGADNATALNYQGAIQKQAGQSAALGTIINGASSLYTMYATPKIATGDIPHGTSTASGQKSWWA